MGLSLLAYVLFAFLFFSPSVVAGETCSLKVGERGRVASIVDGDTVRLEDGREVRLVGVQAPKMGLGRQGFDDWPLAAEAKARLTAMLLNRLVGLAYGGTKVDRYGRLLAHLYAEDGSWVQARMIASGLARVYSFPDNRACVGALLAFEGDARLDQRGIWAKDYYAPQVASSPQALLALENTYQLVEGRVRDVAIVRGRVFLNFGDDWRTDFTIMIAPRDVRRFDLDPDVYANLAVRVRGWVTSFNGPEIVVTHPEQIEILSTLTPPS